MYIYTFRLVDLDITFERTSHGRGIISPAWKNSDSIRRDLYNDKTLLPDLLRAHLQSPETVFLIKKVKEHPKITKNAANKLSNFDGFPSYLMELLYDMQYFNLNDAYFGENERALYHKDVRVSVGQFIRWLFMVDLVSLEDMCTPFKVLYGMTAERYAEFLSYRQGLGYKNVYTAGYQLATFLRTVSLAIGSKKYVYINICFTLNGFWPTYRQSLSPSRLYSLSFQLRQM